MEQTSEKTGLLLRLALCSGGAALLYGGALRLPALEEHRPWLEEHRLQVIALGAAALLGVSLVLLPRQEGSAASQPDDCCDGYEPVE